MVFEDEVEPARRSGHLPGIAGQDHVMRPEGAGILAFAWVVVIMVTSAPSALANLDSEVAKTAKPATATFFPGPTCSNCRSGDQS
jgi:hypothetical protein